MSWFFALSKHSAGQSFPKIPYESKPLCMFSCSSFQVAFGGVKETCLYEYDEANQQGWGVVGVGILHDSSGSRIMTHVDWQSALENPGFTPASLDGHFIALRWNRDHIEFFNDQIGLRTLYYNSIDEGNCHFHSA